VRARRPRLDNVAHAAAKAASAGVFASWFDRLLGAPGVAAAARGRPEAGACIRAAAAAGGLRLDDCASSAVFSLERASLSWRRADSANACDRAFVMAAMGCPELVARAVWTRYTDGDGVRPGSPVEDAVRDLLAWARAQGASLQFTRHAAPETDLCAATHPPLRSARVPPLRALATHAVGVHLAREASTRQNDMPREWAWLVGLHAGLGAGVHTVLWPPGTPLVARVRALARRCPPQSLARAVCDALTDEEHLLEVLRARTECTCPFPARFA